MKATAYVWDKAARSYRCRECGSFKGDGHKIECRYRPAPRFYGEREQREHEERARADG